MMNQQKQKQMRPQIVSKTKDGRSVRQKGLRYRSRMQIVGEILTAASQYTGGLNKTKIMYRSSLSYAQLKDYFAQLLLDELLDYNEKTGKFTVTPKGFRFLESYRVMTDLAPNNLDAERMNSYTAAPGVEGY